MNKIDKKMLIWFWGFIGLAVELIIVFFNIKNLNVLTYLLTIGFLPAILLFMSSFFYSLYSSISTRSKYISSIVVALLYSVILLSYCALLINDEIIKQIISNSITSNTSKVSMNVASAQDNIQSILLFIAFSGVGCFFGNAIHRKRNLKNVVTNNLETEYDR